MGASAIALVADGQLHLRPHGKRYAVYDGDQRLTTPTEHNVALTQLVGIERRRAREAMAMRPCLRCATAFRSAGKHNRLCNPCRGGGLGREFEGR